MKGGGAKPEGEDFVETVKTIPEHTQKFPITWVDWKKTTCRLYVSFGHKTMGSNLLMAAIALSIVMYWSDRVILLNVMLNAGGPRFGEGQVKDSAKFVFFFWGGEQGQLGRLVDF